MSRARLAGSLGHTAIGIVVAATILATGGAVPPAAFCAPVAQVNLAWDANNEPDLAGYKIYYGPVNRTVEFVVDVGNAVSYAVTGLDDSTAYYFAATAYDIYGNESGYSNEVVWDPVFGFDADHDGLSDGVENGACTDPLDADSDDDGIADGVEDADHNGLAAGGETSPCQPDSDGDGLQDGTELGYTLADITAGTDPLVFQPDTDPSTYTDPLNPDTDGDGLLDGEEDANHNGLLDPGETDPNVPDAILVFSDDFSDGDAGGDPEWETVSGKWRVNVREQLGSSAARNSRALVGDPAVGEFSGGRIECRVRLSSKYQRSPNAYIVFGYQDGELYRWVRLDGSGIAVGQVGDTLQEQAGKKAAWRAQVELKRFYSPRISIDPDGRVAVYVDGESQPVVSYSFADPLPGRIGLQTRKSRAYFDDFSVWNELSLH